MSNFQVKIKKNLVKKISRDTQDAIRKSVRTVAQDLARTSSETAPHEFGDLEDSVNVSYSANGLTAEISFSVFSDGFNYAIAMHEWTYNLGEGSQRKTGGTGMSGKSYSVGRKYLSRVFEGEQLTYVDYIRKEVNKQLKG